MYEYFKSLLSSFEEINKKGYINSFYNNPYNGAGLTLKHLLEKDSCIMTSAIRCTGQFSRRPIVLFAENISDKFIFEMADKYEFENLKITPLFSKIKRYGKYNYLLSINYSKKQIFLKIYDEKLMLLDQFVLFDFSLIFKNIDQIKLLSVVYVNKRITRGQCYFHYYKIECYALKSFEDFIQSLVEGKIKISLIFDWQKKNTFQLIFHISKKNLLGPYKKVCVYEK